MAVNINIVKLDPNAVIPSYATLGDGGMDMTAINIEETENYIQYGTGLAMAIPDGFVGLLFPRSSNSKKDLLLCNSVGVIDSGYRGEICFRFKRIVPGEYSNYKFYSVGDKVGQIMIIPRPAITFEEVEELSSTERGTGGFGSTGV